MWLHADPCLVCSGGGGAVSGMFCHTATDDTRATEFDAMV